MIFSNRVYDILRWVSQIALPALGASYFGLASIWGWPYGEQIVGTLSVLTACLGTLLGISKAKYAKAQAEAEEDAYDD